MIGRLLRRLSKFLGTLLFRRRPRGRRTFAVTAVLWLSGCCKTARAPRVGLNIEQVGYILRLTRSGRGQLRRRQLQNLKKKRPAQAARARKRLARAVAAEVLRGLDKASVLTRAQKERLRQIAWQRQARCRRLRQPAGTGGLEADAGPDGGAGQYPPEDAPTTGQACLPRAGRGTRKTRRPRPRARKLCARPSPCSTRSRSNGGNGLAGKPFEAPSEDTGLDDAPKPDVSAP